MDLTREEEALLPSDENVSLYRQHGWYRSRRVLSDALLDHALTGIQRHFSGERDWTLPPTSGFSDWKPGDGKTVRNAEVVSLQNAQVRALALHPILGAFVARLTRSQTIRYFADTLVDKPGGCPRTNPSSAGIPTWPTEGHLHIRQLHIRQPAHDVHSISGLHRRDGTAVVCRRQPSVVRNQRHANLFVQGPP